MRKIILSMLLCLSLLLSLGALSEQTVDMDLTELDASDAIEALFRLTEAPEDNRGKVVRLTGNFSYVSWDDGELFLLYGGGGASCCGAQLEFIPANTPENLEQLTLSNEPITVHGVLDIYENYGYDTIRLIEAQIEDADL